MAHTDIVLSLVKARLNWLECDTSLDRYLRARIDAANEELKKTGIRLDADSTEDAMLLTDYVCWQYQNRDSSNAMPPWLSLRRRERWLRQRDP